MVNSGSFDSADGNRNGKTCTQAGDAALSSQSSDVADDAACKSGCSKSADGDLPSDESAIEPTPTKTEINSSMVPITSQMNNFPANDTKGMACPSLPLEKAQNATNSSSPDNFEEKTKHTRKLLCLFCDRSFVSANLRQKHVERVHSVKSTRRVSARRQNQLSTTPCPHCDKLDASEHTLSHLFQHLAQEHATKYFGCLSCEQRFLTSNHLAEHNRSKHYPEVITHTTDFPAASQIVEDVEQSPNIDHLLHKVTRSKLRSKVEGSLDAEENTIITKRRKKSKLKELRNKKLSVKSSKIAIKRSKRLQQQAKDHELKKKRRERKVTSGAKPEATSITKQPEKSKAICVNPYPEFDHFYRVKKITDHSIDNLKISSLTFDDVFDKAFFNRIKCNIEENLLHHIDGKLFKNEESENRISNFEKISTVAQEVQNSNADNYGCEISLNAITPACSLSLSSQFGEDFESQIEYGSKPSKKRTQIKSDEVHYKYFTRRKYQASILQQKENRDLSKLDMWTQMVVKERQEKVLNKKKSAKEIQEYNSCQEYRSKVKRQELNRILDRRGPFEDLKEEASKKAAFDKLNSSSDNDISQEVFTDVREVLNDLLNRVFEAVEEDDGPPEEYYKEIDDREIPAYLDLRRKTSSTQEEMDKSDRIALICSSQETENFELPTNTVRAKNELVELTGEWARSRMYICAACGGKFSNIKYLLEHKSLYHQNVWVQHYEFVGNQSELYRHLSIPGLGKIGIVEDTVACKQWKRSNARTCTKCGKQCNALGELHRHVLECGEDWTWLLARKKCRYRPFGAKSRRKRRGFEQRIHHKRKTEPTEKKIYKKRMEGPRQRPSDADTIQRMLANLPAKRSRRSIISLSDVVFKSRKTKRSSTQPLQTKKAKCGKAIHNKSQMDSGKPKPNQQRTNRVLRSLNKVLSSRILDLNSSLLVKRKIKVIRSQRLTRNMMRFKDNRTEVISKETATDESLLELESGNQKKRRTPKKESPSVAEPETLAENSAPNKNKSVAKRMLNTRLNLKNFFPVKKKGARSVQKNTDLDKLSTDSEDVLPNEASTKSDKKPKYLENFENLKKNKRGGLKGFVRALSLRKRNSKSEESVAIPDTKDSGIKDDSANLKPENTKKSSRLKTKEILPSKKPDEDSESLLIDSKEEVLSKKRKVQRSFRNVINKVKKFKTEKSSSKTSESSQSKNGKKDTRSRTFLEESLLQKDSTSPEKFAAPDEVKENMQEKEDLVPIVSSSVDSKKNSLIPEMTSDLENKERQSLRAKAKLDFNAKQSDAVDALINSNDLLDLRDDSDSKTSLIDSKTTPVLIDTSLKSKSVPLISPNIKGKMRKPSRGLNDCIAMLTSKLQHKDEKISSSLESLFSTSSTTSIERHTENRPLSDTITAPIKMPKLETLPKIPTFSVGKSAAIEETALDLSKKSVSTPNILFSSSQDSTAGELVLDNKNKEALDDKPVSPTWTSVDDIIQQVVQNSASYVFIKPKRNLFSIRNNVDKTIDSVISSSLDWFEKSLPFSEEAPTHRRLRRKKYSDDNLITNIIFGKDKLIIAPSSNPTKDFEDPLIAKIKENEYRTSHLLSNCNQLIQENIDTISRVSESSFVSDVASNPQKEANNTKQATETKGDKNVNTEEDESNQHTVEGDILPVDMLEKIPVEESTFTVENISEITSSETKKSKNENLIKSQPNQDTETQYDEESLLNNKTTHAPNAFTSEVIAAETVTTKVKPRRTVHRKRVKTKYTKLKSKPRKPAIETNIDDCLSINEIPSKEPDVTTVNIFPDAEDSSKKTMELRTENEPVVLENKVIEHCSKLPSDSEDEVPLAIIAKLEELGSLPKDIQSSNNICDLENKKCYSKLKNSKNSEQQSFATPDLIEHPVKNTIYPTDSLNDTKDMVETLTTDSLKENLVGTINKNDTSSNLISPTKTLNIIKPIKKKKRKKVLSYNKRHILKKKNGNIQVHACVSLNTTSHESPQLTNEKDLKKTNSSPVMLGLIDQHKLAFAKTDLPSSVNVATLDIPSEAGRDSNFPETKPDGESKIAIKMLNTQRTRRKSKSSKKIDKIDNDLFKDFSLVINKKTKRIPPTNIVDDSVCDDILDENISFFVKPLGVSKGDARTDNNIDPPLNDSVEEMDMEIEDIPISTSIIERDEKHIANLISYNDDLSFLTSHDKQKSPDREVVPLTRKSPRKKNSLDLTDNAESTSNSDIPKVVLNRSGSKRGRKTKKGILEQESIYANITDNAARSLTESYKQEQDLVTVTMANTENDKLEDLNQLTQTNIIFTSPENQENSNNASSVNDAEILDTINSSSPQKLVSDKVQTRRCSKRNTKTLNILSKLDSIISPEDLQHSDKLECDSIVNSQNNSKDLFEHRISCSSTDLKDNTITGVLEQCRQNEVTKKDENITEIPPNNIDSSNTGLSDLPPSSCDEEIMECVSVKGESQQTVQKIMEEQYSTDTNDALKGIKLDDSKSTNEHNDIYVPTTPCEFGMPLEESTPKEKRLRGPKTNKRTNKRNMKAPNSKSRFLSDSTKLNAKIRSSRRPKNNSNSSHTICSKDESSNTPEVNHSSQENIDDNQFTDESALGVQVKTVDMSKSLQNPMAVSKKVVPRPHEGNSSITHICDSVRSATIKFKTSDLPDIQDRDRTFGTETEQNPQDNINRYDDNKEDSRRSCIAKNLQLQTEQAFISSEDCSKPKNSEVSLMDTPFTDCHGKANKYLEVKTGLGNEKDTIQSSDEVLYALPSCVSEMKNIIASSIFEKPLQTLSSKRKAPRRTKKRLANKIEHLDFNNDDEYSNGNLEKVVENTGNSEPTNSSVHLTSMERVMDDSGFVEKFFEESVNKNKQKKGIRDRVTKKMDVTSQVNNNGSTGNTSTAITEVVDYHTNVTSIPENFEICDKLKPDVSIESYIDLVFPESIVGDMCKTNLEGASFKPTESQIDCLNSVNTKFSSNTAIPDIENPQLNLNMETEVGTKPIKACRKLRQSEKRNNMDDYPKYIDANSFNTDYQLSNNKSPSNGNNENIEDFTLGSSSESSAPRRSNRNKSGIASAENGLQVSDNDSLTNLEGVSEDGYKPTDNLEVNLELPIPGGSSKSTKLKVFRIKSDIVQQKANINKKSSKGLKSLSEDFSPLETYADEVTTKSRRPRKIIDYNEDNLEKKAMEANTTLKAPSLKVNTDGSQAPRKNKKLRKKSVENNNAFLEKNPLADLENSVVNDELIVNQVQDQGCILLNVNSKTFFGEEVEAIAKQESVSIAVSNTISEDSYIHDLRPTRNNEQKLIDIGETIPQIPQLHFNNAVYDDQQHTIECDNKSSLNLEIEPDTKSSWNPELEPKAYKVDEFSEIPKLVVDIHLTDEIDQKLRHHIVTKNVTTDTIVLKNSGGILDSSDNDKQETCRPNESNKLIEEEIKNNVEVTVTNKETPDSSKKKYIADVIETEPNDVLNMFVSETDKTSKGTVFRKNRKPKKQVDYQKEIVKAKILDEMPDECTKGLTQSAENIEKKNITDQNTNFLEDPAFPENANKLLENDSCPDLTVRYNKRPRKKINYNEEVLLNNVESVSDKVVSERKSKKKSDKHLNLQHTSDVEDLACDHGAPHEIKQNTNSAPLQDDKISVNGDSLQAIFEFSIPVDTQLQKPKPKLNKNKRILSDTEAHLPIRDSSMYPVNDIFNYEKNKLNEDECRKDLNGPEGFETEDLKQVTGEDQAILKLGEVDLEKKSNAELALVETSQLLDTISPLLENGLSDSCINRKSESMKIVEDANATNSSFMMSLKDIETYISSDDITNFQKYCAEKKVKKVKKNNMDIDIANILDSDNESKNRRSPRKRKTQGENLPDLSLENAAEIDSPLEFVENKNKLNIELETGVKCNKSEADLVEHKSDLANQSLSLEKSENHSSDSNESLPLLERINDFQNKLAVKDNKRNDLTESVLSCDSNVRTKCSSDMANISKDSLPLISMNSSDELFKITDTSHLGDKLVTKDFDTFLPINGTDIEKDVVLETKSSTATRMKKRKTKKSKSRKTNVEQNDTLIATEEIRTDRAFTNVLCEETGRQNELAKINIKDLLLSSLAPPHSTYTESEQTTNKTIDVTTNLEEKDNANELCDYIKITEPDIKSVKLKTKKHTGKKFRNLTQIQDDSEVIEGAVLDNNINTNTINKSILDSNISFSALKNVLSTFTKVKKVDGMFSDIPPLTEIITSSEMDIAPVLDEIDKSLESEDIYDFNNDYRAKSVLANKQKSSKNSMKCRPKYCPKSNVNKVTSAEVAALNTESNRKVCNRSAKAKALENIHEKALTRSEDLEPNNKSSSQFRKSRKWPKSLSTSKDFVDNKEEPNTEYEKSVANKDSLSAFDEEVANILNTPTEQYESDLLSKMKDVNDTISDMTKNHSKSIELTNTASNLTTSNQDLNQNINSSECLPLATQLDPNRVDGDGLELRRSRRGSRKIPSYNENDLIDPLVDALENRRNRSSRKDKSIENYQTKNEVSKETANEKPKLSAEELFDILKKSSYENVPGPKPSGSFFANLNNDPSNSSGVYQDIANDGVDGIHEKQSEPAKLQDADKIYEFTEESPDNTEVIKELFGKSKKKLKQQNMSVDDKIMLELPTSIENNTSLGLIDNNSTDKDKVCDEDKSNYCDICKKSFIRIENLVKHKTTLTHISKLSELEAKEAEEKAKLESQKQTKDEQSNSSLKTIDALRDEINITDILQQSERSQITIPENSPSLHNNHSLKLVDIISDVLNKPVLETYNSEKQDFSASHNEPKVKTDSRRYKSLGERKSFESESHAANTKTSLQTSYHPSALSQTTILEKQINLLENIIGNNLENIIVNKSQTENSFIDEISSCSNNSNVSELNNSCATNRSVFILKNVEVNSDADFIKPTQYEEISEDSSSARIYEDPKQRKTLNRDEELFLECCSLLKSGSEVSNSNYSKKVKKPIEHVKEVDQSELLEHKKLIQTAEEAHEFSDNSRTPTPLGDTYDDDASNSNTISSNWHLRSERPLDKNRSFSFEEVKSKEASGMTFGEILTKGLRNQFENINDANERCRDALQAVLPTISIPTDDGKDDSDSSTASKKIATKGARKVYEGLKVSIPTEDLNLDVLNTTSPLSKKTEVVTAATLEDKLEQAPSKPRSTRKSKPVKKSQVGSNLLFKVNKKKSSTQKPKSVPTEKQDIYNFEESQDNVDIFIKPIFKDVKSVPLDNKKDVLHSSDNDSLGYADSIGADAKSVSSVSSVSAMSSRKPETTPENITKKKYKIMGKIFRNAAKSKMDDIDEDLRSIPEIPEIDNLELVENYVRSCQRVKSPFLPPPPPPPLDDIPKKPKMTEEEMSMLFDQLLGKEINESTGEKPASKSMTRIKADYKNGDSKKKSCKVRNRKRGRGNSESSDDEFNINRTARKRTNKKSNQDDSGINLELELKECIGVASRKSQRTCTSGKQNILLEYWSSDEEAFEAMLESHKILTKREVEKNKNDVNEQPSISEVFEKPLEKLPKLKPKKKVQPTKKTKLVVAKGAEINTTIVTASNRRKRAAANPLYHWSSSSEDESQSLIEIKPIREEDDEDDRPIQHGWIVGDSPKKLVTMLALTKGKKNDIDSVKEQGKRRTSNTAS